MAICGGSPLGPPNMPGEIFERDHPVKLLDGDYDVFGDGSVILFFVGGHTPGSQVCLVHLKNTGFVLLSGDALFTFVQEILTPSVSPRIRETANEREPLVCGPKCLWHFYMRPSSDELLSCHNCGSTTTHRGL